MVPFEIPVATVFGFPLFSVFQYYFSTSLRWSNVSLWWSILKGNSHLEIKEALQSYRAVKVYRGEWGTVGHLFF